MDLVSMGKRGGTDNNPATPCRSYRILSIRDQCYFVQLSGVGSRTKQISHEKNCTRSCV